MKKTKTVPLPCNDEQFKTIKMYCISKGIKYNDLTIKLIHLIEGENEKGNNTTNNQ